MHSELRTLDLSDDLVDVIFVVSLAVVSDAELSVGGLGGTVTIREVVDDNLQQLLGAGALAQSAGRCEVGSKIRDLRDRVCRLLLSDSCHL